MTPKSRNNKRQQPGPKYSKCFRSEVLWSREDLQRGLTSMLPLELSTWRALWLMGVLVQCQGLVVHIAGALIGALSAAHAVTKDTRFGLTCVGRCSRQPSNPAVVWQPIIFMRCVWQEQQTDKLVYTHFYVVCCLVTQLPFEAAECPLTASCMSVCLCVWVCGVVRYVCVCSYQMASLSFLIVTLETGLQKSRLLHLLHDE